LLDVERHEELVVELAAVTGRQDHGPVRGGDQRPGAGPADQGDRVLPILEGGDLALVPVDGGEVEGGTALGGAAGGALLQRQLPARRGDRGQLGTAGRGPKRDGDSEQLPPANHQRLVEVLQRRLVRAGPVPGLGRGEAGVHDRTARLGRGRSPRDEDGAHAGAALVRGGAAAGDGAVVV